LKKDVLNSIERADDAVNQSFIVEYHCEKESEGVAMMKLPRETVDLGKTFIRPIFRAYWSEFVRNVSFDSFHHRSHKAIQRAMNIELPFASLLFC
jgi:hypothetical protein